jgi:ornithine cyclodeaminase/alanine dehydrogenase-like protein (mu-crystallin family)
MKRLPVLDGTALAAAKVADTDALAAIEAALAALGRNEAQQPQPPALSPGAGAFFAPLIAALPKDNVACVNWLTYHPHNVAAGLPHSGGLLILNDFATGEPLCLMDGIWISQRRAGYVAALGVKYLAGNFHDAAVIGPGAIAAFALDAIVALGLLQAEIRVCGRRQESAERFCAQALSRRGIRAAPGTDPRAAVRGARLVLTSTSHTGPPFLEFDWLIPGTLVVMIDRLRVITRGLLARAGRIVTNSRESLASWGVEGRARVHATMPEIIAEQNRKPVGPHEIVLYDAGGLAVADLAFAALLWRRLQSSRQASLAARRT